MSVTSSAHTPIPNGPIELYTVWSRESVSPVVRRVLDVIVQAPDQIVAPAR